VVAEPEELGEVVTEFPETDAALVPLEADPEVTLLDEEVVGIELDAVEEEETTPIVAADVWDAVVDSFPVRGIELPEEEEITLSEALEAVVGRTLEVVAPWFDDVVDTTEGPAAPEVIIRLEEELAPEVVGKLPETLVPEVVGKLPEDSPELWSS